LTESDQHVRKPIEFPPVQKSDHRRCGLLRARCDRPRRRGRENTRFSQRVDVGEGCCGSDPAVAAASQVPLWRDRFPSNT